MNFWEISFIVFAVSSMITSLAYAFTTKVRTQNNDSGKIEK